MTPPGTAWMRFLGGCVLGLLCGAGYGFLRPLRPRWLGDCLFSLLLCWCWLCLGFGICQGDLRLAYTAGLPLGAVLFDRTAGKWLHPAFSAFWRTFFHILGLILGPIKNIFKKMKILIASAGK